MDYQLQPVEHDPFAAPDPVVLPPNPNPFANNLVSRSLAQGIMNAAMLPKQALDEASRARMEGDYNPAPVMDAAMLATTGGIRSGIAIPERNLPLASHGANLYNPPVKSARPFEADYPQGAPSDATGKLLTDIDGRPLSAERIVGRRSPGGGDEALTPAQINAATEAAIGAGPQAVAARQIGGDAGRVVKETDRRSGQDTYDLFWNRGLSPVARDRVVAHEFGHVVDEIAGQIPTGGLSAELRQIYNTLNTGTERFRNLSGPEHFGYRGDDIPREHMAEAIRAYMTDPNYIKTVAPKTAAAIRAAVNGHPRLSSNIQFNSLPPIGATGALAYQFMPVDHDPFAQ